MKKVWIDAGHGGRDPGAVGNGIQEKDIALTVSLGIKQRLEAGYQHVQVLLSRSTDIFLELRDRTTMANRAGADILISIHCNAGGGQGDLSLSGIPMPPRLVLGFKILYTKRL